MIQGLYFGEKLEANHNRVLKGCKKKKVKTHPILLENVTSLPTHSIIVTKKETRFPYLSIPIGSFVTGIAVKSLMT